MDINELKRDGMIKELKNEQRAKLQIIQSIINRYLIDSAINNNKKLNITDLTNPIHDFKELEKELESIDNEILESINNEITEC